jgi:hypothetical protein
MRSLPHPGARRRDLSPLVAEARRQRDRAALEAIWRRIATPSTCALCRDGRPGPRCAACILRGTRP